jgi:hypothetical protein
MLNDYDDNNNDNTKLYCLTDLTGLRGNVSSLYSGGAGSNPDRDTDYTK